MSLIFTPHCDDVCAYTFPLVRTILEGDVGIPSALKRIPLPFRDSLVATLATELANISAVVLQLGKKSQFNLRLQEQLLVVHGGAKHFSVSKQLDGLRTKRIENADHLRKLELMARSVSDTCSDAIPGAAIEVLEAGATIRWRYDIVSAARVDYVRTHLRAAISVERELRDQTDACHQTYLDLGKKIRRRVGYRADYEQQSWKQMKVAFSSHPGLQADGAALFLRNIDFAWWGSFTAAFAAAVENDGLRRIDRMALRDPAFLREIRAESGGSLKWYASASKCLDNPSLEWGKVIRTPKALKRVRKDLISQDQESMEWLREKGRDANFYTQWLRNLHRDVERSNIDGYWFPSELNKEWLNSNLERFCHGPVFENEDWRFNELSWCLSFEHPDLYEFVPLVSHHQNREAWDAHRAEWWAQIEAAKLNPSTGPRNVRDLGPERSGRKGHTAPEQAHAKGSIKSSARRCKRTTHKARTRHQ